MIAITIIRWFEEHHPEQGNFTHESDRDAIRAVLAKQVGWCNCDRCAWKINERPRKTYSTYGTVFCVFLLQGRQQVFVVL